MPCALADKEDECALEMPADVDPATVVDAEGMQTVEEQALEHERVERSPRKAREGAKGKGRVTCSGVKI
jgi:hypothetical protein